MVISCFQFHGLADNIRGEESNTFTNTLGESITVKLMGSVGQTAELLSESLNPLSRLF